MILRLVFCFINNLLDQNCGEKKDCVCWRKDWDSVWRFLVVASSESFLCIALSLLWLWCSETTLTGESRFYISTPLGIWTWVPCDGKQPVVHWTSETWWEWSEIVGCQQGFPLQPTLSVVKLGRRTCSKRETRTEKLCDQVDQGGLHIVGMKPSEAPEGWQSRWLTHYWHEA